MDYRLIIALLFAKVAMHLSRLSGRGRGSSLPGAVALRICPNLLKHYQGQARKGVIMITGTNGKTTTSNMLADILTYAGFKVLTNREGANLITGVAAAFIKAGSLTARIDCDYVVLEVDEAAFPGIAHWIKPDKVVVTNFFRDQLDRYGELDTTINKVLAVIKQLPDTADIILNADDPLVVRLAVASGKEAFYYGVLPEANARNESVYNREAKFCPFCGAFLMYHHYIYSQLGDFKCSNCDFKRPLPDLEAQAVELSGSNSQTYVNYQKSNAHNELWPLHIPAPGIYNIYNALAALAASLTLGVPYEKALFSLTGYTPATGRMEAYTYHGKPVLLTLVKNPTGFNQALKALLDQTAKQDLLIAINDNDADGRDISWLWDVDFEILTQHADRFSRFICSGQRAEEMSLRFKYAGLPVHMLTTIKDYREAVSSVLQGREEAVSILATYTALWPVEKILRQEAEKVDKHVDSGSFVS